MLFPFNKERIILRLLEYFDRPTIFSNHTALMFKKKTSFNAEHSTSSSFKLVNDFEQCAHDSDLNEKESISCKRNIYMQYSEAEGYMK